MAEETPNPATAAPARDASSDATAQLRAELAARDEHIHRLNAENADRRKKTAEVEAANRAALEEQGQYKALAESLKKSADDDAARYAAESATLREQLAKLAADSVDAERFRAFESAEKARIAKRIEDASVPSAIKIAVKAATSVDVAREILAAFDADKASAPASTKPGSSSSPPVTGGGSIDFAALSAAGDMDGLTEAIRRDPAAWAAHVAHSANGSRKASLFGWAQK